MLSRHLVLVIVMTLLLLCFVLVVVYFSHKEKWTQREVHIMGLNGCGLGNNLCQVATGIYYARKYNYTVVLNSASDGILWGTSHFCRDRRRKEGSDQIPKPYTETLFSKLPRRKLIPLDASHVERMEYGYDGSLVAPKHTTTILQLNGLCQNKDFYEEIIPYFPLYLNLNDVSIEQYLWQKYQLHRGQTNNVMISLRIGADFAHMTKVNPPSLHKAIQIATKVMGKKCRLVVISDTDEIGEKWEIILKDFSHVIVVEDDITQFYAGLCCESIILGESTYHYWIALCRSSLYQYSPVYLFKNTDLTNRNLALNHWIQLDLVET